jgi:hypothetical protein
MPFFFRVAQFKASVWSYYRSQGLTDDDDDEDEEEDGGGSVSYDREPIVFGAVNSPRPPPGARRPGDLLRADRARRNLPPRAVVAAGDATTESTSDGDLTANITAMPLPGPRRA